MNVFGSDAAPASVGRALSKELAEGEEVLGTSYKKAKTRESRLVFDHTSPPCLLCKDFRRYAVDRLIKAETGSSVTFLSFEPLSQTSRKTHSLTKCLESPSCSSPSSPPWSSSDQQQLVSCFQHSFGEVLFVLRLQARTDFGGCYVRKN